MSKIRHITGSIRFKDGTETKFCINNADEVKLWNEDGTIEIDCDIADLVRIIKELKVIFNDGRNGE